jgi:hypothetical protein
VHEQAGLQLAARLHLRRLAGGGARRGQLRVCRRPARAHEQAELQLAARLRLERLAGGKGRGATERMQEAGARL